MLPCENSFKIALRVQASEKYPLIDTQKMLPSCSGVTEAPSLRAETDVLFSDSN